MTADKKQMKLHCQFLLRSRPENEVVCKKVEREQYLANTRITNEKELEKIVVLAGVHD